jgi:hypothetical protein
MSVQENLEEQLRKLRSELKYHEKKLKNCETKGTKDERKSVKRRREEPDVISNKRLRSLVEVVSKNETDPTKQKQEEDDVPTETVKKENADEEQSSIVNTTEQKEDTKTNDTNSFPRLQRRGTVNARDRRLFSNLLQGTLISFNKSSTDDKIIQKRKEVEMRIEEKVASEQKSLLEAEQQRREEEKQRCVEKVLQVKEDIKQKESELRNIKFTQYQQLLSGFLKTKATPPIYFYPSKTDEFTERVLSTKKKIEPPKETTAPEEQPPPNPEEPIPTATEGDDVEIEAFTREKEVPLPMIQPLIVQQYEEDIDETREDDKEKKNTVKST